MSDPLVGNYGVLIATNNPDVDFVLSAKGILQTWGDTMINNISKDTPIDLTVFLDSSIKKIFKFNIIIYSDIWRAYQHQLIASNSISSLSQGGVHSHPYSASTTFGTTASEPIVTSPYTSWSDNHANADHRHGFEAWSGPNAHGHSGPGGTNTGSANSPHGHGSNSHTHPLTTNLQFLSSVEKVTGTVNIELGNVSQNLTLVNDICFYDFTIIDLSTFVLGQVNNLIVSLPSTNNTRGSLQVTYFIQAFMSNV